ncbi:hypothetical protein LVISKB_1420 [Levilactobacillus brevis KB290]|uniref:Uncharacterized protein n=1 Tax=Levilactobacillus brevis KB290 TaxID=1001583 RepID=M5AF76_LEVBR|nr:hypothetical protein LVISKB_1420 [Levilactobacillus brevis KB290]
MELGKTGVPLAAALSAISAGSWRFIDGKRRKRDDDQ